MAGRPQGKPIVEPDPRHQSGEARFSMIAPAVVSTVEGLALGYLPRAFGPGGNVNSTAREVVTMAHVSLSGGKAPNGKRMVSPEIIRQMTESRVRSTVMPPAR